MPSKAKANPKRRRRTKHTKKSNFWDSKLVILDVWGWNTQVAFAVNMGEKEILRSLVDVINKNDPKQRSRARETAFMTDLAEGVVGWDEDSFAQGRLCPCGASYVVLLRLSKDRFREGVGIVTHEVTHVVQRLLRARRVPLTEDTEEVYAYLTESITKDLLFALYD